MLNEEVIDVVAEEVTEQPTPTVFEHETVLDEVENTEEEQPQFAVSEYGAYVQYKKTKYKLKKLKEQVMKNNKSQRGFGYIYKELEY